MMFGRWCVQLADMWHCYLSLCVDIMVFYKIFIVSVHSTFIFVFTLVIINQTEWLIPACPAWSFLLLFLTRQTLQFCFVLFLMFFKMFCVCMFCFLLVKGVIL